MLRFVMRFIGLMLFAAAFIALVADGTRSIVGHELALTSTAQAIGLFAPNFASGWQSSLSSLWEPLWDPLTLWLLASPAVAVFGILGLLLMAIGRPKARVIGLART